MKLVIIDYDASNLHSVRKALQALGHAPVISNDPSIVEEANALVLPGVGAAGDAMRHLRELGLVTILKEFAASGRPFLGVCVGMQLLFESSDEGGGIECLGLLPGCVRRLPAGRKVPHMGWNSVKLTHAHRAFEGIPDGAFYYFVHSYYPEPTDATAVLATTEYGLTFASVVARENLLGVQFHPEKSSSYGLRLYDNFVRQAAERTQADPLAATRPGQ